MTSAQPLPALFAAVFAYVVAKLHGHATGDEIRGVAKKLLDELDLEADAMAAWATAEPVAAGDVPRREREGRTVRTVVRIVRLGETAVRLVPTSDTESERVETVACEIIGADGERFRVLDVVGDALVGRLRSAFRSGGLVEFLGYILLLPVHLDRKSAGQEQRETLGFFLHLVDLRPCERTLDLLGASRGERESAEALLGELRSQGRSPLDYLIEQVTLNLKIVGLSDAPLLAEGIEGAVLQAFSSGRLGNTSARIHILLIGPPGQGKKLVGLVARVLNPFCQEASAAKVSPAGLAGASHHGEAGWTSTPGLIPLAAEGVLVIQDAQALRGQKFGAVAPILLEVIEDGEVRDAVAGGKKRVATTATLIDLNRASQAMLSGVADEVPILRSLPLLSRVDIILEIPVDPEHAWMIGALMYGALRSGGVAFDSQPWVRAARLLVALVRDEHPTIDTSQVVPMMEAAHEQLRLDSRDLIEMSPMIACAIPVRMPVSFMRLVTASARACDRSVADADDVQCALRFVRTKLDFLRATARPGVHVSNCPTGRRAADEDFWLAQAGRTVVVSELAREYTAQTGKAVSSRTIRRELERRFAVDAGFGRWQLPPAHSEPGGSSETPG